MSAPMVECLAVAYADLLASGGQPTHLYCRPDLESEARAAVRALGLPLIVVPRADVGVDVYLMRKIPIEHLS